jgi:hypothetical protein
MSLSDLHIENCELLHDKSFIKNQILCQPINLQINLPQLIQQNSFGRVNQHPHIPFRFQTLPQCRLERLCILKLEIPLGDMFMFRP